MAKKDTVRSFIALELDEPVQSAIARIQSEFKKTGADVKWVKPANIHLTLKFLGDIFPEQIPAIQHIITDVALKTTPLTISLSYIGTFPRPTAPKVIWVGTEKECAPLIELARILENRLEEIGFEKENRVFKAHATMGRIRSSLNRHDLIKKLKTFQLNAALPQSLKHITLFKSTLTPHGPIYETLSKHPFAAEQHLPSD